MQLTRREFLATTALAPLSLAGSAQIRVGITTNTVGGWDKDVFRSFQEAQEVGYRNVETFISGLTDYYEKPEELQKVIDKIGVRFVTISNGGPMETRFEDPARHPQIIKDHLRLVRFLKNFGCTHSKNNLGPRRPTGTTREDLRNMAKVLNEVGRRSSDLGIKFAVHAHMWNQFENRREIDYIMSHSDPKHVWFVLDTGHITLAGINPVELTRTLGHRIVEFHVKDTKPEHRGGAKVRMDRPKDYMKDPPFFPLGNGGVDYPAIKAELDRMSWKGWWTVELDSSPFRPPKESARISKDYLERTIGLKL